MVPLGISNTFQLCITITLTKACKYLKKKETITKYIRSQQKKNGSLGIVIRLK